MPRPRSVAVAAIAAFTGLISMLAPIAHAEKLSENTIKSECASAGGTYSTVSKGGTRFSTCTYKDNEGNKFRDYYMDGGYYSTRPF